MTIEIEQYLVDEYKVIHFSFLTHESDIKGWLEAEGDAYFDCGQGYATDEVDLIVATQDGKFYEVNVKAKLGSQEQDRGTRLYWVDRIKSVKYMEIPKPEPKLLFNYDFSVRLTDVQRGMIDDLFKRMGVEPKFIAKHIPYGSCSH